MWLALGDVTIQKMCTQKKRCDVSLRSSKTCYSRLQCNITSWVKLTRKIFCVLVCCERGHESRDIRPLFSRFAQGVNDKNKVFMQREVDALDNQLRLLMNIQYTAGYAVRCAAIC